MDRLGCVRRAPARKERAGGLRNKPYLNTDSVYFRKKHVLSNRFRPYRCRRFGERHGAGSEAEKARRTLRRAREGLCFFLQALANGSTLQPAESDASHDMTLQRKEEDDDRNDSQSRAGHLQLILVASPARAGWQSRSGASPLIQMSKKVDATVTFGKSGPWLQPQ